jgi:hypothetical protein
MKHKTVAIIQSNYIPWKGYFDVIRAVDEFVLLDSVQYTRRDWRNRNVVKTAKGVHWLTIPVEVKGKYNQPIDGTKIQDLECLRRHLKTIEFNYRAAAQFREVFPWLRDLFLSVQEEPLLTRVNEAIIRGICKRLGIVTPILRCTEVLDRAILEGFDSSDRLSALCHALHATCYVSGPSARDYIKLEAFAKYNIEVRWVDYAGYPEYPQLWGRFEHGVSIIDLLLNTGADALRYMRAL